MVVFLQKMIDRLLNFRLSSNVPLPRRSRFVLRGRLDKLGAHTPAPRTNTRDNATSY